MNTFVEKNVSEQSRIKSVDLKNALKARFNDLIESVFENQELVDLASLNNIELTQRLYIQMLEDHSRISPRELRKLKRRAEANKVFYEHLEKLGGTLKAKEVAELLNVKRQTVNNRLKSNKLIGIKSGGDFLYPSFQFTNDGMLPFFVELNSILPESLDAVGRISFFTIGLSDSNEVNPSPLDILKRGNVTGDELFRMKRSARLHHTGVAR